MAFTTPTRSHGDQCIERACVSVTFHGAGSVIVLAHAASGSAPARRMPSSHSHSAVVSDIARRFIHRSLPRSGDGAVVVVVVVVVATIEVPGSAASAASDAVSASAFAFAAAASLSASATLPFNRASSRATAADDAVSPLAAAPGASGSFCTSERRGGVQRRQAWS